MNNRCKHKPKTEWTCNFCGMNCCRNCNAFKLPTVDFCINCYKDYLKTKNITTKEQLVENNNISINISTEKYPFLWNLTEAFENERKKCEEEFKKEVENPSNPEFWFKVLTNSPKMLGIIAKQERHKIIKLIDEMIDKCKEAEKTFKGAVKVEDQRMALEDLKSRVLNECSSKENSEKISEELK